MERYITIGHRKAAAHPRKSGAKQRTYIRELEGKVALLKEEAAMNSAALEQLRQQYRLAQYESEKNKRAAEKQRQANESILHSFSWKLTKPLRAFFELLKKIPSVGLFAKGLENLAKNGVGSTCRRVGYWRRRKANNAILKKRLQESERSLPGQRRETFPRNIKFSIVVPLYNTPLPFLKDMIQSVQEQTYGNWELCMVDGSDEAHGEVGQYCLLLQEKDPRIRYRKLEKNLGISQNTNACLDMATGDFVALFDHDDMLHPSALYEVMHAICEQDADFIYTDENSFHKKPADAFLPHFKPDYAPDSLLSCNYICHLSVFRRSLLDETGLFDPLCDGSQDHDMVLRLTERAKKIVHIPKILYYWRSHAGSVAGGVTQKPYVFEAGVRAVQKSLDRRGVRGTATTVAPNLTIYRVRYEIHGRPLVSILIPNYEHLDDLKTCISSIYKKSTYDNFEIVIVENNSKDPALFGYYEQLQEEHENLRVVQWAHPFNFSAICNYGVQFCKGDYYLLLNNDTEVITPAWIEEMLMFVQRDDVAAAGAKLYYPDGTVQHGGVVLGVGGVAANLHCDADHDYMGYMGRLLYAQDLSAVTAACMLVKRSAWEQVGGFDEAYAVAFNDVDFCMKLRAAGYLIVWTPFAELTHFESKSRGYEDTPQKQARFSGEVLRFQERWKQELAAGDPYYNPNFSLDSADFMVK